jgi:hypothetical protein
MTGTHLANGTRPSSMFRYGNRRLAVVIITKHHETNVVGT